VPRREAGERREPGARVYNVPPMEWWLWLLVGLAFTVLELASAGGFYLIFFGISALLLGVAGLFGLSGPAWVQWIAFAAMAVIMLAFFRGRLLRMLRPETDVAVDSLVGEIARTLDAIAPGAVGRAELRGSTWSARNAHSAALERGQRCRVQRVDGLMLFLLPE
jgi:inner membrane protein